MQIGNNIFDLEKRAYIMGILNATPDSFSDGGSYENVDAALRCAEQMVKDGAAIIDVGGESTRPGYEKVSDEEEIARVVPVIEAIKSRIDVPVSIDTYKSVVAKEALAAGADMVNDIWGLQVDGMADVVAKANASVCIMHNRDNVKKPYVNLMDDVISDICTSIQNGMAAGIDKDKIVVDPGIGFAKTYEENIMVLREIERLKELGYPILLGTSRKSVIGLTLDLPVTERLEGTIATTVYGIMKGCSIIRVHDVKENYRALKMTEAMLGRY
jgi:dihydropteroate synthase